MFQLVGHRIRDPRNTRPELSLSLCHVHEPFFERVGVDVVVELWMSELFVQVIELDTLWRVVAFDRLHPGDVGEEWRSSETAEYEHRVATTQQRRETVLLTLPVVDRQIWQPVTQRRGVPLEPSHERAGATCSAWLCLGRRWAETEPDGEQNHQTRRMCRRAALAGR